MKIRQIDIKGERYDIEAFINPIPTGAVFPFAGTTAPEGFLLCDGSAVSRITYAKLFEVIGELYGSGDGSTTFNLPNSIDRYIEGTKNEVGRTVEAGLPNITGSFGAMTYTNGQPIGVFKSNDENTNQVQEGGGNNKRFVRFSFDATRSSSIYGNSNTVQPPAIKMQYIIKY